MQNRNSFGCEHIFKKIKPRAAYDAYSKNFYGEHHIETFKLYFKYFVWLIKEI